MIETEADEAKGTDAKDDHLEDDPVAFLALPPGKAARALQVSSGGVEGGDDDDDARHCLYCCCLKMWVAMKIRCSEEPSAPFEAFKVDLI